MKTSKLHQSGFSHLILPSIVVLAVVIVGVRALSMGHADSVTLSSSTSAAASSAVKNVAVLDAAQTSAPSFQSSVPYSFVGTQTVNQLSSGQSITYSQVKEGNITSCFEIYVDEPKEGEATASIEFANNNNYVTKKITSNDQNNLQQVCVPPSNKSNPGFNIKNLTPATQNVIVEVYQDVLSW